MRRATICLLNERTNRSSPEKTSWMTQQKKAEIWNFFDFSLKGKLFCFELISAQLPELFLVSISKLHFSFFRNLQRWGSRFMKWLFCCFCYCSLLKFCNFGNIFGIGKVSLIKGCFFCLLSWPSELSCWAAEPIMTRMLVKTLRSFWQKPAEMEFWSYREHFGNAMSHQNAKILMIRPH